LDGRGRRKVKVDQAGACHEKINHGKVELNPPEIPLR
jgi:hypothetical protein